MTATVITFSMLFSRGLLLDQAQGKNHFRHSSLKRVMQTGPTIQDQSLEKKTIKKHQQRCDKYPFANRISTSGCASSELLRLQPRISVLRLQPLRERFAIVVTNRNAKMPGFSIELEQLG